VTQTKQPPANPGGSIQLVVDRYGIGRIPLSLHRGNDAAFDPIMDDPKADAISLSNLTNVQSSFGRRPSWNAIFVPQPFDRTQCNWLTGRRAFLTFGARYYDDVVVTMIGCQL
jgi:hypothetical protein